MSLKILIAVTHLLGAGHLTRAIALARAFARAGHDATLVSGGRPVSLADAGAIRLVQLPPVQTQGTDFRALLDEEGRPVDEARLAARRALLLDTLRAVRPQVLITELFPFGRRVLADEFLALVEAARALRPRPLILSSIRDILAAPSRPERIAETHERIARLYDGILVHGDPRLVPLEASWPVDGHLAGLLAYTGYVDEGPAPGVLDARRGIIVSGGSSAASLPLYRTALDAAREVAGHPWRILVGRGVEEADFRALAALAPPHATVERARPDFRTLLAGAEVSVSQAGYNTCVDSLRSGVRPVLVPFEAGRETEQRLRAERLAAQGRAALVPEADLSGLTLADAVRVSLARPLPGPAPYAFDGARRSVALVEEWARAAPALHAAPDWSPLTEALARARDRGVTPGFWWRDDDAVAATPPLDRLLALANRFDAGIALAAIPLRIASSLPERLAGEKRAFALVHGSAHANHAPPGEKKAEFSAHRPLPLLIEEAEEALRHAGAALGGRLLPVFVPPWNRIAPELVAELPRLGYEGLSTFRDRRERHPVPGLLTVNTHLDPIDWHGTRSLVEPNRLVAALAEAVERRTAGLADPNEPIGLLTHHLVHDERVWTFCENLMVYLSRNNAIFRPIDQLFRDPARIAAEP